MFVDGCFWHGFPQHATKPRNNAVFWRKKLTSNKARDRLVTRTLRRAGWQGVAHLGALLAEGHPGAEAGRQTFDTSPRPSPVEAERRKRDWSDGFGGFRRRASFRLMSVFGIEVRVSRAASHASQSSEFSLMKAINSSTWHNGSPVTVSAAP